MAQRLIGKSETVFQLANICLIKELHNIEENNKTKPHKTQEYFVYTQQTQLLWMALSKFDWKWFECDINMNDLSQPLCSFMHNGRITCTKEIARLVENEVCYVIPTVYIVCL